MRDLNIAVLGATSLVGQPILKQLATTGCRIIAYTRKMVAPHGDESIQWRQLPDPHRSDSIDLWLAVAPIWVLPDYFPQIEASGATRLVALSSTSRFTKAASDNSADAATAARLAKGEHALQTWAAQRGIEWVILRPTLIYGYGRDQNISAIAHFIRRFHLFPLLGRATGLRQPIHAEDVATAALAALQRPAAANRAYNVSGGETLTYRQMVQRIFIALGIAPRLITIPRWSFRLAVAIARHLPRYRHLSTAMAERMNRDLIFDHRAAARDLNFKPRAFVITAVDLPPPRTHTKKLAGRNTAYDIER